MNPGFFEELKRRKVYRVAIAYIVAAWALAQGLSQVLPVFEISNSVIRVVIALLLIGFPVALMLAWVFDITPRGIQRTSRVTPQSMPLPQRRRNLILLALVGAVIACAAGFFVLPRAVARKIDKSIAVLPFENFSDDKENAYFADGIQDDILTNLSKIGDLKVISRTSVMPYRGAQKNVRDIGKALGVSKILEGSVRRYGNKVRVNVQLIDATNDQHLWAEDYDGDLSDVFQIQTDLAGKIAQALQAKLSPMEKEHLARKPTQNSEAYLAFVRAHDLHTSSPEDFARLKEAEERYEDAITRDPKFVLALARNSQLQSWIYHSFEPTTARKEKAVDLAERALKLDPNSPEAHLARGFAYYYGDRNYAAALSEFSIAQAGLPNESEVYLAIGAIQRRQGKWDESTANLKKACELDPKSSWPLQNLAFNYEMLRNAEAERTIDKALELAPKSFELWGLKIQFAIEQRGDFSAYDKAVATFTPKNSPAAANASDATPSTFNAAYVEIAQLSVLILQRRFPEVISVGEKIDDNAVAGKPDLIVQKYGCIGLARRYSKDEQAARRDFMKARDEAQKLVAQTPESASRHLQLAQTMALLGEKDAAVAEALHAQQLLPESEDAFEGPQITEGLAEIYGLNGDADRAIPIIDGLLQRPSALTTNLLKLQLQWDPIRNDPRFKALIDKYGAKT